MSGKNKLILTYITFIFIVLLYNKDKLLDFLTVRRVNTSSTGQMSDYFQIRKAEKVYTPKVGIVLLDLGPIHQRFKESLRTNLKFGLGLSLNDDINIIKLSLKSGHDTMLLLPSQPFDYNTNDPGPNAILVGEDPIISAKKVEFICNRTSADEVGIYLSPDSVITMNNAASETLARTLEENSHRFKFFAYYDQTGSSVFSKVVDGSKISNKVIRINTLIDSEYSADDIIKSLDEVALVSSSDNKTYLVGIYMTSQTLIALNQWEKNRNNKIKLLSISDILSGED